MSPLSTVHHRIDSAHLHNQLYWDLGYHVVPRKYCTNHVPTLDSARQVSIRPLPGVGQPPSFPNEAWTRVGQPGIETALKIWPITTFYIWDWPFCLFPHVSTMLWRCLAIFLQKKVFHKIHQYSGGGFNKRMNKMLKLFLLKIIEVLTSGYLAKLWLPKVCR